MAAARQSERGGVEQHGQHACAPAGRQTGRLAWAGRVSLSLSATVSNREEGKLTLLREWYMQRVRRGTRLERRHSQLEWPVRASRTWGGYVQAWLPLRKVPA